MAVLKLIYPVTIGGYLDGNFFLIEIEKLAFYFLHIFQILAGRGEEDNGKVRRNCEGICYGGCLLCKGIRFCLFSSAMIMKYLLFCL